MDKCYNSQTFFFVLRVSSDADDKQKSLLAAIQQRQAYEDQIAECRERLQEFQAVAASLDRPICLNPEETQEQLNDYQVSKE